jgi:hypothetical protein
VASVFKAAGASKYTIIYHDGTRRRKVTGTTDKAISQRIANELEAKVALRKHGLIDPAAEADRDHEAKPLAHHLHA